MYETSSLVSSRSHRIESSVILSLTEDLRVRSCKISLVLIFVANHRCCLGFLCCYDSLGFITVATVYRDLFKLFGLLRSSFLSRSITNIIMFVSFRWLDIPLLLVFLSASLLVQGCELDKEGCAAGDTILVDAVTRCESCLLNAALSHDSCAYFGEEADPNYCTNVDACRDSDCRFLSGCQAAVDDLAECLLQEETVFQCPLSCAQFSPSAVITVPTTISPAQPSSSPPPVGSPTPAEPAVVTYTVGPGERASFTCPRDSFCCPSQGDNIWEGLDADKLSDGECHASGNRG